MTFPNTSRKNLRSTFAQENLRNVLRKCETQYVTESETARTTVGSTGLDGSEYVPEVKARRDEVFKHVDKVEWRDLSDRVTSVHRTHHVHTTVLVNTDQHTTCTQQVHKHYELRRLCSHLIHDRSYRKPVIPGNEPDA